MEEFIETGHYAFRLPHNKEIKIWRYMDLAKYLSVLQRSALFFCKASLLGDPFEGSVSKPIYEWRDYLLKNRETDPQLSDWKDLPEDVVQNYVEAMPRINREHIDTFMVNCWHMNEHESAAMWKLYASADEAVCIQSTYRRIRKALPQCVYIGEVQYVDYERDSFPQGNVFFNIMHKRKSFEHERELRAVYWSVESTDEAKTIAKDVDPNCGVWINVTDLSAIVENVYVSPTAPRWFGEVVSDATRQYGLGIDVKHSSLSAAPLY